jgi:hypothetical protein
MKLSVCRYGSSIFGWSVRLRAITRRILGCLWTRCSPLIIRGRRHSSGRCWWRRGRRAMCDIKYKGCVRSAILSTWNRKWWNRSRWCLLAHSRPGWESLFVELHISRRDDRLATAVPQLISLRKGIVAHKDSFPCLRVKLLSIVVRHMVIGFTAVYPKVRNIWFSALPEFMWCLPLVRTGGCSIINMTGSRNCCLPKALAHPRMVKHTTCFFHYSAVEAFSSPILLWRVGHRELMLNTSLF